VPNGKIVTVDAAMPEAQANRANREVLNVDERERRLFAIGSTR